MALAAFFDELPQFETWVNCIFKRNFLVLKAASYSSNDPVYDAEYFASLRSYSFANADAAFQRQPHLKEDDIL